MAKRILIGDKLYLFTDDTGEPADNLLISSHGGYYSRPELGKQTGIAHAIPGLGGWITVPYGTDLYFYGPHKMILQDPGIQAVIGGGINFLEEASAGTKVRNYRLSKYQTKTGETYDSIKADIDANRAFIQLRQEAIKAGDQTALAEVQRCCPNPFPKFDVLTVRNRWFMSTITLSDALKGLSDSGAWYPNVHCVFCRSRMIGSSKTYDARVNPPR